MVTVSLLLWMASVFCQAHQQNLAIRINIETAASKSHAAKLNPGVHVVDKSALRKKGKKRKAKQFVCPKTCMCMGSMAPPDIVACSNSTQVTFPWELHRNTTQLSIHGGNLGRLSPNMFKGLTRLKSLTLAGCNISSVMEWSFRNLTSLERLNLARNNFTSIGFFESEGTFPTLTLDNSSVKQLDLSFNKIANPIHRGTFAPLRYLQTLKLSGNQVHYVDDAFSDLWGINELDLSRNNIRAVIPGSFEMALKLKRLDLSHNALRLVPKEVFVNLVELCELHLDNNQLFALEEGTFENLVSLEELHLQSNQLKEVEGSTFSHNPKLSYIDLSNNTIETIDDRAFQSCNALDKLLLNKNLLGSISKDTFTGASKVRTLQLSDNRLTSIHEGALDELTDLQYLMLDNNDLESLSPYLFDALSVVRLVSVRNNKLVSLEPRWFLSPALTLESQIILTEYKKRPIPATVGAAALYRDIEIVAAEYDFSGNRWSCGCGANQFVLWLHQQKTVPLRKLKTVHCYTPFYTWGWGMTHFTGRDVFCRDEWLFYRLAWLLSVMSLVALWTFRKQCERKKLAKPKHKNM